MALIFHLFVIALFLVICILTEPMIYHRYRLYKIVPTNEEQIEVMKKAFVPDKNFDFWSEICLNCDVVVLVNPLGIQNAETFFRTFDAENEIYIKDIGEDLIAPADNNFWDSLYLHEVIRVHLGSEQAELLEPYRNKTGIRLFSKLESDSKMAEFLVPTGLGDEFFEYLDKNNIKHEQIIKDIGVWLTNMDDCPTKPKKPKKPQVTEKPQETQKPQEMKKRKRHHFAHAVTM